MPKKFPLYNGKPHTEGCPSSPEKLRELQETRLEPGVKLSDIPRLYQPEGLEIGNGLLKKNLRDYPNASSRWRRNAGHTQGLRAITIHHTRNTNLSGVRFWHHDPRARASAHFYIGEDGQIIQGVPLNFRAWHHGTSRVTYYGTAPQTGKSLTTDYEAVGIEMLNYGLTYYDPAKNLRRVATKRSPFIMNFERDKFLKETLIFGTHCNMKVSNWVAGDWHMYTTPALNSLVKLVVALVRDFDIPIYNILGHEDVAVPLGRKTDPGAAFPWLSFLRRVWRELGHDKNESLPEGFWYLHRTDLR